MRKDSHAKRAGYRDPSDPRHAKLTVTTVRRDEFDAPAWMAQVTELIRALRRRARRDG